MGGETMEVKIKPGESKIIEGYEITNTGDNVVFVGEDMGCDMPKLEEELYCSILDEEKED